MSTSTIDELVIQLVCAKYNIDRSRFDRYWTNPSTGEIEFAFKALSVPLKLQREMELLQNHLIDSFRGPVIEAAVPDLHESIQRVIAEFRDCYSPKIVRISNQELQDIQYKTRKELQRDAFSSSNQWNYKP